MADSQSAVVPFASFVGGGRMEMAGIKGRPRRRSDGENQVVRGRTLPSLSKLLVDSFLNKERILGLK